jgi:hypothetical protein
VAGVYAVVLFAAAFAAIGVILFLLRNANRLFTLRVRAGRVVALRGRAPKKLVRDLEDVLRLRPAAQAVVRVQVEAGMPCVQADGDVTDVERQRLRNVVGTWQVAKIRAAPYRSGRPER